MISVSELSKSFEHRTLFQGLSFGINRGEKIGLIGPNGAGKSTLLKILMGLEPPDSGQVAIQRGTRVGLLSQSPDLSNFTDVHSVQSSLVQDSTDWSYLERTQNLFEELGFNDGSMQIRNMSGGWQKRLSLALELGKEPDILLLDEPTNHLDIQTILWLEEHLQKAPFACLMVTHDRAFLQRTCNRIMELNRRYPKGMLSTQGSYADFLEAKELALTSQALEEQKLRNLLRRETAWLRRGAKARQTKQTARQEATHELAAKVQDLAERNREFKMDLVAQESDRKTKKLIEAKGISKSFGDSVVIPQLDVLITPKTRLGLMGRNGSGKSTLIRLLLGEVPSDTGEVLRALSLEVAYFDQHRATLNPAQSLIDAIGAKSDFVQFGQQSMHVRTYLSKFLFSPQQAEQKVEKLSGGEKARLQLARFLLTPAQILILDEPTNDLDFESLDALSEMLAEFQGAVILVSHDRYFIDQVCNRILGFGESGDGEQKLAEYFADVEQWETWHTQLQTQKSFQAQKSSSAESAGSKKASEASKPRMSPGKLQRELERATAQIEKLEAEMKTLNDELQRPEITTNAKSLEEILAKVQAVQSRLDVQYSLWEELESQKAGS